MLYRRYRNIASQDLKKILAMLLDGTAFFSSKEGLLSKTLQFLHKQYGLSDYRSWWMTWSQAPPKRLEDN